MKKFLRKNDNGNFYAAFSDDGYYKVGIFDPERTIPFWKYNSHFNTLEQAEEIAEMLKDSYDDGYHDGQIDINLRK